MSEAYIVDAVRTPFGTEDGVFSDTHPQDLAAEPLVALEERNGFVGSEDVDDVAHGHPLGATGAALVGKLPYQLDDCDGRYGISTMCIGFGQGVATLVERV
jgi:acetyl-CoA acetyltransferase